jgi:hypothetical protein
MRAFRRKKSPEEGSSTGIRRASTLPMPVTTPAGTVGDATAQPATFGGPDYRPVIRSIMDQEWVHQVRSLRGR